MLKMGILTSFSSFCQIKQEMREAASYNEGKLEGKLETAKEMLLDKLSIEKISKYTGITIEEIEELAEFLK